jgi:hypothetical protein
LQETLGSPNKPAGIVAQIHNESACGQPAKERDRGVQKRLIIIDVETPNPQIPKPAVTGGDRPRREEVRERVGGAYARPSRAALCSPERVVEAELLRTTDGLGGRVDRASNPGPQRAARHWGSEWIQALPVQADLAGLVCPVDVPDDDPLFVRGRRVFQGPKRERFQCPCAPRIGTPARLTLRVQLDRAIERNPKGQSTSYLDRSAGWAERNAGSFTESTHQRPRESGTWHP